MKLYNQDHALATEFLTTYSDGLALQALDKAFGLEDDLRSKMAGEEHDACQSCQGSAAI